MKARRNLDEDRTLRVLLAWPASKEPAPTPLVERCEIALDTRLRDFSKEQIRLLIGQEIGLEYLVPKALAILTEDPMIGVTHYPGDLLSACLRVNKDFWALEPRLRHQLLAQVENLDLSGDDEDVAAEELQEEMRAFRQITM
ncbi:contact-dependent growth inhibition system immunity protein [Aminobacter aminovorans]|uniref:contact-dependent growth inhibition system immunity protein n=1 Tax=Aminobacter aminovorans TaxID=83263 RepID=UPI002866ED74|nr:contact-dependent growth inhibition system immunity protein [Aminobacter aminovorans]MDR7219973.1 hypothetical protein [Aminobacter aminovorans]